MRVLVACEESQEVCKAFRAKGHEAFSCDIQDCSGGHPEWHIKGDALKAIKTCWHKTESDVLIYIQNWDLIIAHPPCTYFSRAGIQFIYKQPDRMRKLLESFDFLRAIWNADCPMIAIENPVGWLNTNWKKPNQKFHPWHFGDNEMKETCLWLKGLRPLKPIYDTVANPKKYKPKPASSRIGSDGKMKNKYFMQRAGNAKNRSKTFPGIAKAMAEQWG